jgi:hypothetical protein
MKLASLLLFVLILTTSCSKSVVVSGVTPGAIFPSVSGESLEKKTVKIPEDFEGSPVVLLVGYLQKAQFDIDRWILGLLQLETKVKFVEVPTIAGMMPEMVQGFINNGMRKGIPESDWKSVVTIFGDAEKIVATLGNERPTNAYVVLLDSKGAIIKVFNNGYSASNVKELHDLISGLEVAKCSSGLN